ncbi:ROK family transcriptional regulator [Aeromicrobium sp. IC_218]|uniref:ROK family transcriptional regulator n=1 Tax=Aeromicrobium sp. IC_218 TaxID=2545468 RepID=UPI0013F43628|nr:ROK family transcriptional regulator [Aeromicrobium sp. IC_218]
METKSSPETRRPPADRAVLTQLVRSRPSTRTRLAAETGMSAATVSRAVDHLVEAGVVREGAAVVAGTRGRRAVTLDLDASRGVVVGVDLGATSTRLLAADLVATPVAVRELDTATGLDAPDLAAWLAELVLALAEGSAPLLAVSLGLPGAVQSDGPVVTNANNLPQVEDPAFVRVLRERLGVDLHVLNDADLALLGEQSFGAARGAAAAAILTFGTGLGGALARQGVLVQGPHGVVGEFGQLPVGPLGTRLEHMVTGPGIMRRAAEAGLALSSPADLFTSTAPAVASMRAQFDGALVIALTAVTVAAEPDVLVLGGRLAPSLAPHLPAYEAAVAHHVHCTPRLAPAALGSYSGACGAVVAALRGCYRDLGVDEDALGDVPMGAALDLDALEAVRA